MLTTRLERVVNNILPQGWAGQAVEITTLIDAVRVVKVQETQYYLHGRRE